MARRAIAWTLTLPLVGVSVLVGHALAYAITGRSGGGTHDYLAHAPAVLALASLVGLLGLAIDSRAGRLASWPFASAGALVFALLEHVEHVAHTGDLPFLLADRTFLVGVALQAPVGATCAWLARRLVRALRAAAPTRRPAVLALAPVVLAPVPVAPRSRRPARATLGRGPPRLFRP